MTREEAIKELRGFLGQLTEGCQEAIKVLIPELSESEDEKIRKAIVALIEDLQHYSTNYAGVDPTDMLTYLEKQKERKPIQSEDEKEYVRILKGLVSDFIRERRGSITSIGYYQQICDWLDGRHVEQKSTEWSEEDEEHLKWLCGIIRNVRLHGGLSLKEESELAKWIDKWINHEPQLKNEWSEFDEDCLKQAIWYVENPSPSVVKNINLVLWLKSLPERFNLQPKQEWSKEDENKLNHILEIVHIASGSEVSVDEKEELESFLRSLRPHPKKEWSKEDEEMFDEALTGILLAKNRMNDTGCIGLAERFEKAYKWLKSLRPQSSWKPSEEQKPETKLTGWVARDRNEEICVYADYPERDSTGQFWLAFGCMSIDQESFPNIKWEDEPMEVEITIRRK